MESNKKSYRLVVIERLQALQADAKKQREIYPSDVVVADELVMDFCDAFRKALQHDNTFSGFQLAKLNALDDYISSVSGPKFEHVWFDDGLECSKEWAEIRTLASNAIYALGCEVREPKHVENVYVTVRSDNNS